MAMGQKKGPGGGNGGGDGSVEGLIRYGTNAADSLRGGKGNDTFYGLAGDDSLSGGDGTDIAVFGGSVLDFDWQVGKRGKVSITDLNPADGDEGSDTLTNIEVLQFDDYTYYLDGRANVPLSLLRTNTSQR